MKKHLAQLTLLLRWIVHPTKLLPVILKPLAPRVLFRLLPVSCQEWLSAWLTTIVVMLTTMRQLASEALQAVYLSVCTRLNAQTACLTIVASMTLVLWSYTRLRDWWVARRASRRLLRAIAESDVMHSMSQIQPPPIPEEMDRIKRVFVQARYRRLKQACRQYRQLCRTPKSFHGENLSAPLVSYEESLS